MEKGKVCDEYITSKEEREAISKWNHKFTRQDHPAVIQVHHFDPIFFHFFNTILEI